MPYSADLREYDNSVGFSWFTNAIFRGRKNSRGRSLNNRRKSRSLGHLSIFNRLISADTLSLATNWATGCEKPGVNKTRHKLASSFSATADSKESQQYHTLLNHSDDNKSNSSEFDYNNMLHIDDDSSSSPTEASYRISNENDLPHVPHLSPGKSYLQQQQHILLDTSEKENLENPAHIAIDIPHDEHLQQNSPSSTPSPSSSSNDLNATEKMIAKSPPEIHKTFIALLFTVFSWFCTVGSLSVVHDRYPRSKPLPDVVHSLIPYIGWALAASEYIIIFGVAFCFILVVLHKYRWIILRRLCFIVGLLYLGRSITMLVTALPPPDDNYKCDPPANVTNAMLYVNRVFKMLSGGGLTIGGSYTLCGDYIYSGHTCILVMCYLVTREYAPRRLFFLSAVIWVLSLAGIVMVAISRGHYTIDIVLAYYITTRVFWTYHTMACNHKLKEPGNTNYLAREWWFPIMRYFEANVVDHKLPNQYEWPLPWPRRCRSKAR